MRGDDGKNLLATTSPMTSHMLRIIRLSSSNPLPFSDDLNAVCSALENGLMGKYLASKVTHAGASLIGMKTSEINSSGNADAFTIAGAASAFGTIAVMAMPSVQKVAHPTSRAVINAGRLPTGRVTS